jgi:quercetin dioxygenase-like cupin family protein
VLEIDGGRALIRAINKEQAMSDTIDDIVKISPDVHQVLFENEVIRVLEVTVRPGAKIPSHTNPANVNYIIEPGTLRLIEPDGSTLDLELAERQVIPAPVGRHAVENVGASVVRTICIELKSSR